MSGVTRAFVDFVSEIDFSALPAELTRELKFLLLDHIGCGLVGASVPKGEIAVRLSEQSGGFGTSSILGGPTKVPPANAAFANGELMNALDWDPIPHTWPCLIPASLALGERERISGRDLILSLAIANEVSSRLADALPGDLESSPHGYSSCILGGVAASARILKLPPAQIGNAFGIAGFAAPVPMMKRFEGGISPIPMTKYVSTGLIAQLAVTSALLAEAGYTGDGAILDDPEPFWRAFGNDGRRWDADRLVQGLGTAWRIRQPWYKRYPCEIIIGFAVSRLNAIMEAHGLAANEIEAIAFASLPLLTTPCHTTTEIVTHIDAQFSVPYVLAVAAHQIEVGPAWQSLDTMRDPRIAELMARISVEVHPNAERWMNEGGSGNPFNSIPCSLVVSARGSHFEFERREEPPMTETEIVDKFVRNARIILPDRDAQEAVGMLTELEDVDDISSMMRLLVPRSK